MEKCIRKTLQLIWTENTIFAQNLAGNMTLILCSAGRGTRLLSTNLCTAVCMQWETASHQWPCISWTPLGQSILSCDHKPWKIKVVLRLFICPSVYSNWVHGVRVVCRPFFRSFGDSNLWKTSSCVCFFAHLFVHAGCVVSGLLTAPWSHDNVDDRVAISPMRHLKWGSSMAKLWKHLSQDRLILTFTAVNPIFATNVCNCGKGIAYGIACCLCLVVFRRSLLRTFDVNMESCRSLYPLLSQLQCLRQFELLVNALAWWVVNASSLKITA